MLQTLSIKQFAIIDELDINFSDGLTVMSGETGSGKSIIIDAIGQLIGMRASSDYVRHGEKKAIIEGIFDIDESKDAINILESLAIDAVSYTHLTLPTTLHECRSRWSPYH